MDKSTHLANYITTIILNSINNFESKIKYNWRDIPYDSFISVFNSQDSIRMYIPDYSLLNEVLFNFEDVERYVYLLYKCEISKTFTIDRLNNINILSPDEKEYLLLKYLN